MYKNQYILVEKNENSFSISDDISEMNKTEFSGFFVYSHKDLNVSIAKKGTTEILLLGFIIDPFDATATNNSIIQNMSENCSSTEAFFKQLQLYTGRYVIVFKTHKEFAILGDACHTRQIFHGNVNSVLFFTSSPRLFYDLFELDFNIDKLKEEIIVNPEYIRREGAWFGSEYLDARLNKLLPNHHYNIVERKSIRTPIYPINNLNTDEDILNYCCDILKGTYDSLISRYTLIQPLTAGWDSRVLLAASKKYKDNIKYYVFNGSGSMNADAMIPTSLGHKLELDFKVINVEPDQLRKDFLTVIRKEHILPLILPKTANIQYHYDQKYGTNIINVNGNASAIATSFYGYTSSKVSLDMLLLFSGYHNKIPYFCEHIENWYYDAKLYSKEFGISLLDLFYWEQRMGNWGSIFPFQQDIALEEVSPFNNKNLLLAILKIQPQKRVGIDNWFYRKIMNNLWKEVLSEPFNPHNKHKSIKRILKGYPKLKYLSLRALKAFKRS